VSSETVHVIGDPVGEAAALVAEQELRIFSGNGNGNSQKAKIDAVLAKAQGLGKIAMQEFPPIDWTVKNLLPTGFAIFSGGSKLGKTWICLQLASAVSLGMDFLGNGAFPCQKGEVLLLALQIAPRVLHNRMEVAGILGDDRVSVLHAFPRGDDALAAVRRWKELHPATRLVIVDMMEQVRDRDPEHENKYSVNVQEISAWAQLAEELMITILGTTHDRKAASGGDFVSDIMGSVGTVGSAAVLWSIKRNRGKSDATLYASGWEICDQELPMAFEPSTAWRLLEGTVKEHQQSREREEILEMLRQAAKPMAPKDVAAGLQKNPVTVRWLLVQMKKDGIVETRVKGRYSPTNTHIYQPANSTNARARGTEMGGVE
jgi:hypothetical protein